MSGFRQFSRQFGLGRLVYRWIHQPRQQFDLARTYGWQCVWDARRGETQMRQAAATLDFPSPTGQPFPAPICFLTGRHFVHQTLFCAHSFLSWSGCPARFEFLSDGSLEETAGDLRRLVPTATIRNRSELDATVAQVLPPEKFPVLHAVRNTFVLLRKLTDAMAGQAGYRLLFDSDMLFWRRPDELLERAGAGAPLYMADTVADGYTASRAEMTRALGVPVAEGVNSGLVGLDAGRIDWDLMERACHFLRDSAGDQRLLEQTLWAVALAAQKARPLDAPAYRVVVDPPHLATVQSEGREPTLLHYAWRARLPYAAREWRRHLETTRR